MNVDFSEPISPDRRAQDMKRNILFLISLSTVLLLAACGSDTTEVTSGDQPDDTVVDLPVDSGEPNTTLPSGPLGGGGPLVTLDITISHPDLDDVTYTISCLGDTATIIGDVSLDDFAACNQLAEDAVRTRLLDGKPQDQVCTEIYGGPDVAIITGTYDGVDGPAVDTTIDRTNGCGIDEWDSLLSNVLPTATGAR